VLEATARALHPGLQSRARHAVVTNQPFANDSHKCEAPDGGERTGRWRRHRRGERPRPGPRPPRTCRLSMYLTPFGNDASDDGFDGGLLHVRQHVDHHLTATWHHAENRRLLLLQRAATAFPPQTTPPPLASFFSRLANLGGEKPFSRGIRLCPPGNRTNSAGSSREFQVLHPSLPA